MQCLTCHTDLHEHAAYCPLCGARQPDVPERDDFLYSAFISYRHRMRDEEVAKKVQQAIETYRLPAGVAQFYGAPKLDRVFRDADELPTTGSLPDSIAEALARSRALIVICSPDTPDSRWVAREIELFASLHGRSNIHLVLADGTSAESIPRQLLTRLEPQLDGTVYERNTEPLAADFRPSAAKREDQEKLRIIAALVGCSYDDLAQRERTRQRKRVRTVAALVLLAALAIGAFAYNQLQATAQADRTARAAEVQQLATQSAQLYAQADRYGAIKTALKAAETLPNTDLSNSSDAYTAVHDALQTALQVQTGEAEMWVPAYTLDLKAPVDTAIVSQQGGWLAVLDESSTITTFRTSTGETVATITLPKKVRSELNEYTRIMIRDAGTHLVVATNTESGYVASYNPYTGACEWNLEVPADSASAFYNDSFAVAHFASYGVDMLLAWAADVDMGASIGQQLLEEVPLPQGYVSQKCVMGKDASSFFLALDDSLFHVNLETGELKTAHAAYGTLQSIDYGLGTFVVVTTDGHTGSSLKSAIEAFDEDLNSLWRIDGTVQSNVAEFNDTVQVLYGMPTFHGFPKAATPCLAFTVGRDFYVFSAADGSTLYSNAFESPIVGVYEWPNSTSNSGFIVARSNGMATLVDPFGKIGGDTTLVGSLNMKYDIRYAMAAITNRAYIVVAALPAADASKVIAYRSNFVNPANRPEPREYTLDELVKLAHETLRADGYE